MKNSKEYSKKLQNFYRSLKQKSKKVEKSVYDEPVDAMVYAIVSERLTEKQARIAIRRFNDYFVDTNDLRVSRPEEIVELLGLNTEAAKNIALSLGSALRAVFYKYNAVSLAALKKMGKRPAKKILEKLDGLTVFVVDYCMLTALAAHAIPLTAAMIDYLKGNELVHPDSSRDEIEGFLARQISIDRAYEFYALLRHESETARHRKKAKKILRKKSSPGDSLLRTKVQKAKK
ncbi:MAG: hypothetical protein JXB29_11580 [Sedimentisphaerales bacterium]|nr:hypothetical protein [Sedimentisphaerales bacterium]